MFEDVILEADVGMQTIEATEPMRSTPEPINSNVHFSTLSVGAGSTTMKVDKGGIWLGGVKRIDAPFSVDTNGRLILRLGENGFIGLDPQLGIWLGNEDPTKASFIVTPDGKMIVRSSGTKGYLLIDGENARIIGNDGQTDRFILSAD